VASDPVGRATSPVALRQTPLHSQFFLWWVSVANGKYCKTECLMKSIEYQMADLTMGHEAIPQVKQPEYPMKSIEYNGRFSPPAGPAGIRWLPRRSEPAGTRWPIGTRWNPLADLVPEGLRHTSHYGIFMEDWNAYRRRQRAVATAKRQAETGFKRGPCPTHAAMQGKKKGSGSRTTPEQQAARRARQGEEMRKRWADPEWRAKTTAAMEEAWQKPSRRPNEALGAPAGFGSLRN
jgi:hypothetical protein